MLSMYQLCSQCVKCYSCLIFSWPESFGDIILKLHLSSDHSYINIGREKICFFKGSFIVYMGGEGQKGNVS